MKRKLETELKSNTKNDNNNKKVKPCFKTFQINNLTIYSSKKYDIKEKLIFKDEEQIEYEQKFLSSRIPTKIEFKFGSQKINSLISEKRERVCNNFFNDYNKRIMINIKSNIFYNTKYNDNNNIKNPSILLGKFYSIYNDNKTKIDFQDKTWKNLDKNLKKNLYEDCLKSLKELNDIFIFDEFLEIFENDINKNSCFIFDQIIFFDLDENYVPLINILNNFSDFIPIYTNNKQERLNFFDLGKNNYNNFNKDHSKQSLWFKLSLVEKIINFFTVYLIPILRSNEKLRYVFTNNFFEKGLIYSKNNLQEIIEKLILELYVDKNENLFFGPWIFSINNQINFHYGQIENFNIEEFFELLQLILILIIQKILWGNKNPEKFSIFVNPRKITIEKNFLSYVTKICLEIFTKFTNIKKKKKKII